MEVNFVLTITERSVLFGLLEALGNVQDRPNRGGKVVARRRKRKSRRRLEGRKILDLVPKYSIDRGDKKPVTAARNFIHSEKIAPPALLLVKRNEHTTDRYFWAEKGLFGAQYVEENHFLFPSLRALLEEEEEYEDEEEPMLATCLVGDRAHSLRCSLC